MTNRHRRSFRRTMTLAVARAAMVTGGFAASYFAVDAVAMDAQWTTPEAGAASTQAGGSAPETAHSVASDLMSAHCAPAPEGTIPGHAVVIFDGEALYLESHLPLEQVTHDLGEGGQDLGMKIIGFCL